MSAEANAVIDTCRNLAPWLSALTNSHVEIKHWKGVSSRQGVPEEAIIAETELEESDHFVFLFWHKFGSPPGPGRVSRWREQRKREDGRYDEGIEYLSGTEEEFEIALVHTKDRSDKRLMVFRCLRPVPPEEIVTRQLDRLNFFLTERVSKHVLWNVFSTIDELRLLVQNGILASSFSLTSSETRARASLDYLSDTFKKDKSDLIKRYLAEECETTSSIIGSSTVNGHQNCKMRTTNLYDRIVDMTQEADHVKIIDLDIRRWNELLNEDDRIYSLNYSAEIMARTSGKARSGSNYKLERIFAIRKPDLRDSTERNRIIRILQKIDLLIKTEKVEKKIVTRIYMDSYRLRATTARRKTPADFKLVAETVRQIRDVVLCSGKSGDVMFRELIDFDEPKRAFETWGEISVQHDTISKFKDGFLKIWSFSNTLPEAIQKLQGLTEKDEV